MSGTVISDARDPAWAEPVEGQRVLAAVRRLAKMVTAVLLSPLRLFLSIRRSMTGSSVTLLLVGIISLNIIWGYPWSGMFSACTALMFVGWGISQIMRPNLKIDFSLPNSSPAGQPFVVVTHVRNQSRLPAMDLSVGFSEAPKPRRNMGFGKKRKKAIRDQAAHDDYQATKTPENVALIHPGGRIDLSGTLVFRKRGIHPLPDLVVTSLFPFHLFQSKRRYQSGTCIAVTPQVLTGEEDEVARGLLNALGGWSRKLLSGDELDYTGSREYEVGMPVRRWDFVSWARLGRPIVREFQSPSIQTVMLVVDTASGQSGGSDAGHELLERVLSLAATAVLELTRHMVRVGFYVTSESPSQIAVPMATQSGTDSESLLIRLAAAEAVTAGAADRALQQAVELAGNRPLLILTARHDTGIEQSAAPNVAILRVDPAQRTQGLGRRARRSQKAGLGQ